MLTPEATEARKGLMDGVWCKRIQNGGWWHVIQSSIYGKETTVKLLWFNDFHMTT